jgi:hypothetical protein
MALQRQTQKRCQKFTMSSLKFNRITETFLELPAPSVENQFVFISLQDRQTTLYFL